MFDSSDQRPTTRATHFDRAKQELEVLAQHLAALGESRLPAEDQLAAETGFSRPTIRSALLALQKEGKVLRQHGVGTFINRHALRIRANLAEASSFLSVIEELGYEPYHDIVRVADEPLPDHVAEHLAVDDGASGVVIDRLFRASDEPGILSRDYVPAQHLRVPASEVSPETSALAFVRRWTAHHVRYSVSTLRAAGVSGRAANLLNVEEGTPVLAMQNVHIDERDEAIGLTEAYVRNDLIHFTVVRTNPGI